MEWIGGFEETLLSVEDESRAEEMVSMLRFKMAHPSGRAEIDECTRIVNRLCCFQSAVSSLLRPLLFREDDWWKPLTAESFSSEIQETLTVLACPLEVLFLGIESGSTVLLCVTPMRLRVMLLKGAAPDVNNVVKNNIILTFLSIHALRSKGRISITSISDQIDAIVSFDSSILSALTVSQTHLITTALATALCHHLKLLVVSPSQNTLLYFLSSLELFMRSQDWAAYLPYLLHHHNWDFLLLNIHNPELCPILSFEWIAIALLSTGTSLLEHFKIDKSSSLTAILIILVHLIEHIQMPSIPSPYQQNIWIQRQRFLKDCHLFMQMDSSLLAKSTSNRIPLFQTAFSLESRTFFFLERASICRQFKVSWSLIEDKGIGYISNITVDSSANSDLTASKALMTTISLQTLTEVHSESTLQSLSNISLSTVIPSTLRRSLRWILCTEFNNDRCCFNIYSCYA